MLILGTYTLLGLTTLYFVARNRFQYIIYSVVLVLIFGSILGGIFKVLHLVGADELLLAGFFGTIIGAILLIWRSFQNRQKQLLLYKLVAGGIILLQIVIMFWWPVYNDRVGLLNYPATAFAATILINRQFEHNGERDVVILLMLQGFLYILIDVLRML